MSIAIINELCKSNECSHDCIKICPQIKKGDKVIKQENDKFIIVEKNCIYCYQCVSACPYTAIVTNKEENYDTEKTKKGLDQIDELLPQRVDPFKIDQSEFSPFSQKMITFARRGWDETFIGFQKGIYSKSKEKTEKNLDGYSKIELASIQGAWSIENLVSKTEYEEMKKFKIENKEITQNITKKKEKLNERTFDDIDPNESTKWIKKVAKFYGADLVGIAPFDTRWIYTENTPDERYDYQAEFTSAIVLAVEMDLDAINTSPKMPSGMATGLGYSKSAFVRTLLTNFIKNLGYQAIPAGNQVGLSVPLSINAGLGGYGRTGLLITKKYGSRVRLAKILTDLPLIHDQPDYKFIKSVERFCKSCMTCAKKCPSVSVSFDKEPSYKTYSKSNNPGINKWYVNVDTCYLFWVENSGDCSNCISDCEYNRTNKRTLGGHRLVMWFIDHVPWLNPIWPLFSKITGFGGNKSAKKYWKKLKT
ncbi:MAG: 4Fe-4S binding protein [Candidatus Hodarchaeales archaeon]|jgi:reductive dehalogenase